jgi:hypothetical protein
VRSINWLRRNKATDKTIGTLENGAFDRHSRLRGNDESETVRDFVSGSKAATILHGVN